MPRKRLDCVELQHRGGARIYEATRGMSQEERLAWWEERNREFRAAREARRSTRTAAPAAR